jgi:zeta-carotene desaturase
LKKIRVAVIGAGVAGISAAVKLSLEGFEVDVFETRGFLGGRTYSFIDTKTDEEIDNGQHLLMGAYENFFKLLDILKTKKYLKFKDGISIDYIDLNGKTGKFDTSRFKGKFGLIWGFLNFDLLNVKEKIHSILFLLKMKFMKVENLNLSVYDLLKKSSQSENLIKSFWQPLCLAVMNIDIHQADAGLFVKVIKVAFFGLSKNAKLVFPKVGLSKLLQPAINIIERKGGKVFFNNKISKINSIGDRVISIETRNGQYFYNYYVSAVPNYILKKMLSGIDESILKSMNYSTIISAYLWLDREVSCREITALLNSTVQWVFNRRLIEYKKTKSSTCNGHIAVTISGANELENLSNKKILAIIMSDLSNAFPEIQNVNILHSKIIRDRKATVALTTDSIKNRINKLEDLSNLFIAGDWTNTGLPATIEGACLSGFLTAERVIHCTEKKIFD